MTIIFWILFALLVALVGVLIAIECRAASDDRKDGKDYYDFDLRM